MLDVVEDYFIWLVNLKGEIIVVCEFWGLVFYYLCGKLGVVKIRGVVLCVEILVEV